MDAAHRPPAALCARGRRRGRLRQRPQGVRGRRAADRRADDADRVLGRRLPARATRWSAPPTTGTRASPSGRGRSTSSSRSRPRGGDLGGLQRLPSNWIADFRRLYDFGEAGRRDLGVPPSEVQPRDADRHAARRTRCATCRPARSAARRCDSTTRARTSPSATSRGRDGAARDRPADGRDSSEDAASRVRRSRARSCATAEAARRSRDSPHAQRWALLRDTPLWFYVLREAELNGGRLARRRRAGRRGDVPPRDGGQHASRSCATRDGARRSGRTEDTFRMVDLLLFAFEGRRALLAPLG